MHVILLDHKQKHAKQKVFQFLWVTYLSSENIPFIVLIGRIVICSFAITIDDLALLTWEFTNYCERILAEDFLALYWEVD